MKITKSPYAKTFYIWHNVSACFFYGMVTPPHRHNTLQLVFGIQNLFACRLENTSWQLYKSVIIRENAIHQLDTNGSIQLLIYMDAGSTAAGLLRKKYLAASGISSLEADITDFIKPGELEECLIKSNAPLLEKLVHDLLLQLTGSGHQYHWDSRVKHVLQLIDAAGSEKLTIRLLAQQIYLSESRLRAVFKKSTGVSIHRYIIWNSIMVAINQIINGATVQDAAVDSGFADSGHFHKLLIQMFGISPSQFIKNNSKKNIRVLCRDPLQMESQFF